MKILFTLLILASTGLVFFSQLDYTLAFWQTDEGPLHTANARNSSASASHIAGNLQQDLHNKLDADDLNHRDNNDFTPNPITVASLRQARIDGDPRAPKLSKHHERETPSEEELGDHEQYLEYEQRQQKRVYRAYVEASKVKTKQIRDMIERGKAEGVSDEEIAFAEEKIRGIEEMAAELQRDYPDIMEDNYQPPADWLIENLGQQPDSAQSNSSTNN